jgi:hypothetical protein
MRQAIHPAVEPEAAHAHPPWRQAVPVSARKLQVSIHHQAVLAGLFHQGIPTEREGSVPLIPLTKRI